MRADINGNAVFTRQLTQTGKPIDVFQLNCRVVTLLVSDVALCFTDDYSLNLSTDKLLSNLIRRTVPVMTSDLKIEKHIFKPGPGANIVYDQWSGSIGRFSVHHDTDMRQVPGEHPCDQIACPVVIGVG